MREELQKLREKTELLEGKNRKMVSERLADADEEVQRMFQEAQSLYHEEKSKMSVHIRELTHQLDAQVDGKTENYEMLENQNKDLEQRIQYLEKEIESKSEFIKKQTQEQESDRNAQDDRIQMLQMALDKIKDKNNVSFLCNFKKNIFDAKITLKNYFLSAASRICTKTFNHHNFLIQN
jgi:predicted RNA-binding protein with RPS1 domain